MAASLIQKYQVTEREKPVGQVERCKHDKLTCQKYLFGKFPMVQYFLVGLISVSIGQLPIDYTSNLGRNHQHTDNDQGEKLGPCLLDKHPIKHEYPQDQGQDGGGI